MNILYLEWNSFCNEDMFTVLQDMGFNIVKIPFKNERNVNKEKLIEKIELRKKSCEFLFSFNYFPVVSDCCKELGIKYVSWVYDNPYINVYSYTVLNSCNYIFLFDYSMYQELKSIGISTVYYLPMAINEKRLCRIKNSLEAVKKYSCDVSFVGSLYTESKHRLYDRFQNIKPYVKGYLEALVQSQLKVYGYNFLQEMLTPEILEEMEKVYPATDPNAHTVMSAAAIYADYVLARQVTSLERTQILEMLGSFCKVNLYTYDKGKNIPFVINKGLIDYYDDMPYVFKNSKINLNITLKSIKTGIPLRAMDIMGCGGFLLTNYQEEFLDYFVPDEDFVFYYDYHDLQEKVKYYLNHEKERQQIAESGCKKVCSQHTMRHRIELILDILEKDER